MSTMEKTTYKYTLDLTRLINQRIDSKKVIKKIGNEIWRLSKESTKNKQELAKIEKEIDDLVISFSKK